MHRLSFITLDDEQAQQKLIKKGVTAAKQRQWVATGPESDNLRYRVDEGQEVRKLSGLRPVRPAASATVLPKVVKVWDEKSGRAFPEYLATRH